MFPKHPKSRRESSKDKALNIFDFATSLRKLWGDLDIMNLLIKLRC